VSEESEPIGTLKTEMMERKEEKHSKHPTPDRIGEQGYLAIFSPSLTLFP
jgi:hypothetical protein